MPPSVVCFVPLKEEMIYIDTKLKSKNAVYDYGDFDPNRKEHAYSVPLRGGSDFFQVEFFVLSGMGNISTASTVLSKINSRDAAFCVLLGIAGTLDITDVALGDVVISSSVKYLAPDKIQSIGPDTPELAPAKRSGSNSWFRFRRDTIELSSSQNIISRYIKKSNGLNLTPVNNNSLGVPDDVDSPFVNLSPKITTGHILGSEWVVDSSEFVAFLKDREFSSDEDWYTKYGDEDEKGRNTWRKGKLACLDMESYGYFRAISDFTAGRAPLNAYSIRGISDPCQDKK